MIDTDRTVRDIRQKKEEQELFKRKIKEVEIYFGSLMQNKEDESRIRQKIMEEIYNKLRSGKPVVLTGMERQGKSSIVRALGNSSDYYNGDHIRLDLQSRPDSRKSMEEGFDDPLEYFEKKFAFEKVVDYILSHTNDLKEETIKEQIESSNLTPLEYLSRWLGDRQQRILLSVDELSSAYRTPGVEEKVSQYRNLEHIDLVIIGHRLGKGSEKKDVYLSDFAEITVPTLTAEEVGQFMKYGLDKLGISIEDEVIKEIWKMSGGRLLEIKTMMIGFLKQLKEEILLAKDVNSQTFKEALKNIPNNQDFKNIDQILTKILNNILYSDEYQLLLQVARQDKGLPTTNLDKEIVDTLTKYGLARTEDDKLVVNGTYLQHFLINQN